MAFSLSGCTRVTASSGESHTFIAGDCLLHDDTSGKGHSTEVISDVPARWVFIRLPNYVNYAAAMSQTGHNLTNGDATNRLRSIGECTSGNRVTPDADQAVELFAIPL
jgi:hypothetical protein